MLFKALQSGAVAEAVGGSWVGNMHLLVTRFQPPHRPSPGPWLHPQARLYRVLPSGLLLSWLRPLEWLYLLCPGACCLCVWDGVAGHPLCCEPLFLTQCLAAAPDNTVYQQTQ
jgi:hypothetical protein